MKAVLLVTVCRRYWELEANLRNSRQKAEAELGYRPTTVLVWARPEVCRLWFMRKLQAEGLVDVIIGRPSIEGEEDGCATTAPESINIRLGLEHIQKHLAEKGDAYVVFHAADVTMAEGTFGFIDHHMKENRAVLFFWENGCVRADIWHTNAFGVCLDPRYWPPVSKAENQDVLERQWGRSLKQQGLPDIHKWHNSGCRRFKHEHRSESLPCFPAQAEANVSSFVCLVNGYRPWWQRLLGVLLFWRKTNGKNRD